MNSNAPVDHAALATSLAQLTSGWSPVQGLAPETLTTARQALASSILAGKGVSDIRAARPSAAVETPVNPQLSEVLNEIAAKAASTPATPTIAVVRSPLAAGLTNPAGLPDWARGAQVINSFGPFQDLHGALHWVDIIKLTVSTRFAFGNPSTPFAVFPVASHLIPASTPKHLSLGSGSVWFLAQMLAAAFPAGAFTGFSVTGGALDCSSPLNLQNGVYVVPPGATLSLTASLAAAAPPTSSGDPGADAAAARFTPPSGITIVFRPTNATFQNIADCSVSAYGTTVSLHRNREAPVASPELHQIVILVRSIATRFRILKGRFRAFRAVRHRVDQPRGMGAAARIHHHYDFAGSGRPRCMRAPTARGRFDRNGSPSSASRRFDLDH